MTTHLQNAEPIFPPSHHAVIILAAGLSTRLGTSKQLLYKNNQPLIEVMTKEALQTQPAAVIIVSQTQSNELSQILHDIQALSNRNQIVINPTPEKGMGQSLYLAINQLKTLAENLEIEHLLILGVDQIHLDSAHLECLLAEKQAAKNKVVVASRYPKDGAIIADAHHSDVIGLPIAIDYAKLIDWQEKIFGDQGLRSLLRSLDACQIATITNPKLCYDIDTKGQLELAQKNGWLDS
ncbi:MULTISPECIES: nucleotidyltransferase family protein [Psychrobacter]|uniref:nucleotidyltransferase family protein n=1 Tax=Psychrobacter TaxID=497 RepID=UPI00146CF5ED|nr:MULTISPECIES: nucleotidyltransferase family protein [Psychrobacter]